MSKRPGTMEKDRDSESQIQGCELRTTAQQSPAAYFVPKEQERCANDRAKVYGSVQRQNFLILSILLATLCGCFNILTCVCSVPAVLASIRSHQATESGDHKRARYLGNISITFMVLTLLLGLVLVVFLAAITVGLAPLFGPCGFSLHKCTKDMFGRQMNTLNCLRWPL